MNRALRIALDVLIVALAAWQVSLVAQAMMARFGANFDLEWMEGATLITGLRAAQGLPFYTLPEADYIPFIYPPLYAWVLGALSHVFPLGYGLGRGISIACTAVATVLLAVAARREGARWPLAVGIAALFVGAYEEGGTFYDLVRIDALAWMFTGAALVVGRAESRAAAITSGLLLAVGFTAKHNMAMLGLPILLWRWRTLGRRDALTFLVASAAPALLFTVAMQVYTHGLFLTYLLEVPATHGMVVERALPSLSKAGRIEGAQAELWRALPLTTTVALLTIGVWARTRGGAYWAYVLGMGLLMVSLMRGHVGGYLNVLVPMLWLLPLGIVVAERALAERLDRRGTPGRAWLPHAVAALVAAQLWEGRGDLSRYVPTAADARSAAALVAELRELPGPMLMPHGPWYPVLAGKEPSFALITLWDIEKDGGVFMEEAEVIDRALAAGRWATVVTPNDKLGHGFLTHYRRAGALKARPFSTRTGWGVAFRSVWHPKDSAKDSAKAAGEADGAAP